MKSTLLPPMLDRPVSPLAASFMPPVRAMAHLHLTLAVLNWLSANDPDEVSPFRWEVVDA